MLSTISPESSQPADTDQPQESGLTYCLVHGSFHGSWCWELLRPELEKYGHKTVAVNLPFEEEEASYANWADIVAQHIVDPRNTVLVTHSRMGNLGPRVASLKAIRQIINLCSGFDPSNNRALRHHYLAKVPAKYHPEFQAGITYDENGRMASIDPETARQVFYHDCSDEVAGAAVAHLRPMFRAANQPPIQDWTDTPASFIYPSGDRVIRREYYEYITRSHKIARNLGARAIMIDGGHLPQLSRPAETAQVIDGLTLKTSKTQTKR